MIGLQTVDPDTEVLTVTAVGFGKRTPESEYPTKGRGGKGMIGHKVSDETGPVVGMAVVRGDEELVVISAGGRSCAPRSSKFARSAAPPRESK